MSLEHHETPFFGEGAPPSNAQGFLLAVCSGIIPGLLGGPYVELGVGLGLMACKASTLPLYYLFDLRQSFALSNL